MASSNTHAVSEAVTRLRDLLGDNVPDQDGLYRWSDPHLLRALSDARRELVADRPEAGYVDSMERPVLGEITTLTESTKVNREYLSDLVGLAFSKLMPEQTDDAANQAAANAALAKAGVPDSRAVGGR